MANSPSKTPPLNRLHISSLLSPPEMKPTESFGRSRAHARDYPDYSRDSTFEHFTKSPVPTRSKRDDAYASPPISPAESLRGVNSVVHLMKAHDIVDPPLFASADAPVANMPLFPRESMEPAAQDTITAHMKSHEYAKLMEKPSRADYELAISFQSNVFKHAAEDPRGWWKQERAFDKYYGRPTGVEKKQPALKKLAPAPSAPVRKNKVAIPRASQSTPQRTPRAAPKAKRSPLSQTVNSFDSPPMSESSSRPARPATTRDDTDYLGLCDYSPPISTLPNNNKCLKAEWKGSVLDLSNDPDRHMLHEAELVLASTLRLTCATYLCSKRRLFIGRIEALKKGKEFRKTDAQQACKIDVNKASKLWSSYDKVGWFNPDYFRQFV
ncbi:hypothetical protein T440DRAFT_206951 [Plenodomus tracheiphilus IPT5]|uniref:SWIRM domain-containing protein n=1 Tax=Plenodomus tracheiphilus IPT5 TaxID=1408161 RepID=A0A6A7BM82_9PLEO|nr:hypothetical protein T440DRAFT_206951 [Plenodomus tracheiphilus IPT5]